MALRAFLAVILAIVIVFIGLTAISYQAQSVEDAAVTNGTNETAEAYNLTTDVYEGVGDALPGILVYGGIGVLVLLALGFLLTSVPGR